jgi:Tfp pilus assembly protein PilX
MIKKLKAKRGEALVESIAAMLLLAMLMVTLAAVVQTALRISGNAAADAARNLAAVNAAMNGTGTYADTLYVAGVAIPVNVGSEQGANGEVFYYFTP